MGGEGGERGERGEKRGTGRGGKGRVKRGEERGRGGEGRANFTAGILRRHLASIQYIHKPSHNAALALENDMIVCDGNYGIWTGCIWHGLCVKLKGGLQPPRLPPHWIRQ